MMKRARPRRRLHRWDVDVHGATEIQEKLRNQLSLKNGFVFRDIRWIAGADVAYATDGDTIFGAVVVLSFPELVVAEESWVKARVSLHSRPPHLSRGACSARGLLVAETASRRDPLRRSGNRPSARLRACSPRGAPAWSPFGGLRQNQTGG
jgi:hypothetical protein